ncbi:MAG: transporter, partial [Chlamydiales bacterium]|nr:transporter [Chlamydiales bacterium]
MRCKYIFGIIISCAFFLEAIEVETEELLVAEPYIPWFTGPLLAPSGTVVPLGSINIEPYIYITAYKGTYGPDWKSHSAPIFWGYVFDPYIQFGVAPRVDLTLSVLGKYNKTHGKHTWGLGDSFAAFGIQVLDETTYIPNIKITFQELFPTGSYNHLNPENLLTDAMGGGSYVTTFGIILAKLIPLQLKKYLNFRLATALSFSSAVHLKGLSVYGGSPITQGTYRPCKQLEIDLSLEYNLSRNWAWALDVFYIYGTKSSFHGKNGENLFSSLGGPLSSPGSQFSLAPAIEYNWTKSLGLIAGCWFTL